MDEQTMQKQAKFWGTFYPALVIVFGIISAIALGPLNVSVGVRLVILVLWLVVMGLLVYYLNRTVRYSFFELQKNKKAKKIK